MQSLKCGNERVGEREAEVVRESESAGSAETQLTLVVVSGDAEDCVITPSFFPLNTTQLYTSAITRKNPTSFELHLD